MPELKTIYDSVDDIPESVEDFRALFTEKNGKQELTGISGVQTPANVARLETSLKKERDDHKETKGKLEAWGDLDHADVQTKLDKYPELEAASKGNLDDAKIEEIVARRVEGTLKSKLNPLERANKKLATENAELLTSNASHVASNTKRSVQDQMRGALRKAKVLTTAEDDALMHSGVFELNDEGNAVTRESVGVTPGMDPEGWLTEIGDRKPHWWAPSQGGGARGSDGRGGVFRGENPWSAEKWNMTAQGKFVTEHGVDKAAKMAAAAGTTLGGNPPSKKK